MASVQFGGSMRKKKLWFWHVMALAAEHTVILSLALRFVANIILLLKSFCYTIWYFNAEHPVAIACSENTCFTF